MSSFPLEAPPPEQPCFTPGGAFTKVQLSSISRFVPIIELTSGEESKNENERKGHIYVTSSIRSTGRESQRCLQERRSSVFQEVISNILIDDVTKKCQV